MEQQNEISGKVNIPVRALIIEDDHTDVELIDEYLSLEESDFKLEVETVGRLSEGLERLSKGDTDVVLLDLTLPDSNGLDTFIAVYSRFSGVPIVILSGVDNGKFASQAVYMGAQDYLVKGRFDGNLLVRSMRYAIERHRLQTELAATRQQQNNQQEMLSLSRLSGAPTASVTAQMLGKLSLREGAGQIFQQTVSRYCELLEFAIEHRIYKTNHNVSEGLLAIAEQLGYLKAGPRDVVEIHSEAIKKKIEGINLFKSNLYIEEGRMILLELMGDLASYYRNHFVTYRKSSDEQR
ncbi:MAG: response regulator [Nitrospirae bacterium]|uniref:response regulator n=1 Tax=Candidatus Magnetobacterium casense TaxID=1455061 RepID=UPI00069737C8|nr:response regulator [Candidatus Magnetobacterium casensis]MBF0336913.1 response regulator [Nitrospirota bacterium]